MREVHVDPLGNQVIINRGESSRRFRVQIAHVVLQAIRMCNECGAHKPTPPLGASNRLAHAVTWDLIIFINYLPIRAGVQGYETKPGKCEKM